MDERVALEGVFPLEAGAAHVAHERLRGRVLRQVQVQLRAVAEARAACRAGERQRPVVLSNSTFRDFPGPENNGACVESEPARLPVN